MTALVRMDALKQCEPVVVATDKGAILVVRRGGDVFAYVNRCPHAAYPLQRADGRIAVQEQNYLVCAAHGASFRLDTGACAGGPCDGDGLKPVAIEVQEGWIILRP